MPMKKYVSLSIFCALLLISCTKNSCSNSVKAQFQNGKDFEGCGMLIQLQNGFLIEPINLSDFEKSPLAGENIFVSYHLSTSGESVCKVGGDLVVIDCLKKR